MPDQSAHPVVVVIAAEAMELDGLRRHASLWEPMPWGIGLAVRAVIDGQDWYLLANGPGRSNANSAMDAACSRPRRIRTVVSAGFCGALDPSLQPGDIVRATGFEIPSGGDTPPPQLPPGPPACQGRFWTIDHVASTAEEKIALSRTGAKAVDMEAGALAASCSASSIPFCAIKVVSDRADEDLPLDFNRYRRADGRFDRGAIARAAALRPWAAWRLWKFAGQCRRASAALGDYLVECRFGENAN
jgi:hypothetical protein